MASTRRVKSWNDLPHRKDKNGKPLCRWCRKSVKPPRQSWCSDKCVALANEACNPGWLRNRVFERDGGICAFCGFNAPTEERSIRDGLQKTGPEYKAAFSRLSELTALGFPSFDRRGWWDADHILPVVEGGGECGIENMRTLCILCHKGETRALAKRRAKVRRKNGLIREGISAIQGQRPTHNQKTEKEK